MSDARQRLREGWGRKGTLASEADAELDTAVPSPDSPVQGAADVAREAAPPQAQSDLQGQSEPPGEPPATNPAGGPVMERRGLMAVSPIAGFGLLSGAMAPGHPLNTGGPRDGPPWPPRDDVRDALDLRYVPSPLPARRARGPERKLAFYNENTGESVRTTFWSRGGYVIEELDAVHRLMRDHHVNEMIAIDLRLLEILHAIQSKLGGKDPFHILSAYRAPRTNAKLSRIYGGVASNSFHMQGRALDIRLPGHGKRTLLRAARGLRAGGVGDYRSHIHIDTGPVRFW